MPVKMVAQKAYGELPIGDDHLSGDAEGDGFPERAISTRRSRPKEAVTLRLVP